MLQGSRAASFDDRVETLAQWVRSARNVVALSGAGISTDSGIPDFRGPQGVWTRNPKAERLSHLHHYMTDPEVRVLAWRARLEHPAWSAEPNDGHRALAKLERMGLLHTLVTQNIDGLHQSAGSSPEVVVEIHGTMREVVCMSCDLRAPMEAALERVRAGEEDPACRHCGGILKSATISFGQSLDVEVLRRAERAARACDVFLAIGTSLSVFPAAQLPQFALTVGARLAILNAEPTPYDADAHVVIDAPLGRSLPALTSRI
jgi:NAD-dependent deacetylase